MKCRVLQIVAGIPSLFQDSKLLTITNKHKWIQQMFNQASWAAVSVRSDGSSPSKLLMWETHGQLPGSSAAGWLHSCCRTKPVPGATAVQKVYIASVKQTSQKICFIQRERWKIESAAGSETRQVIPQVISNLMARHSLHLQPGASKRQEKRKASAQVRKHAASRKCLCCSQWLGLLGSWKAQLQAEKTGGLEAGRPENLEVGRLRSSVSGTEAGGRSAAGRPGAALSVVLNGGASLAARQGEGGTGHAVIQADDRTCPLRSP